MQHAYALAVALTLLRDLVDSVGGVVPDHHITAQCCTRGGLSDTQPSPNQPVLTVLAETDQPQIKWMNGPNTIIKKTSLFVPLSVLPAMLACGCSVEQTPHTRALMTIHRKSTLQCYAGSANLVLQCPPPSTHSYITQALHTASKALAMQTMLPSINSVKRKPGASIHLLCNIPLHTQMHPSHGSKARFTLRQSAPLPGLNAFVYPC